MESIENRIEATLNINKFPTNQTKYFKLDNTQDWMEKLLLELSEKAEDRTPEEILAQGNIQCDLEVTKKQKNHMGNMLIVKGTFKARYVTLCIRTLAEMMDEVSVDIKACFLSDHLESEDEFKDQTEIFEDNEMMELYFYAKGQVPLAEMIHEQVYLNVNQYPVADQDSPLVWGNESSDTKQ